MPHTKEREKICHILIWKNVSSNTFDKIFATVFEIGRYTKKSKRTFFEI